MKMRHFGTIFDDYTRTTIYRPLTDDAFPQSPPTEATLHYFLQWKQTRLLGRICSAEKRKEKRESIR